MGTGIMETSIFAAAYGSDPLQVGDLRMPKGLGPFPVAIIVHLVVVDWAAASDHLRILAKSYPLDLKRVIAVGHSAGASGAFWIAARTSMSANNEIRGSSPINVIAGVAIDGPVDLAGFIGVDSEVCDKPVIVPFMGRTPVEVPTTTPKATLPPYFLSQPDSFDRNARQTSSFRARKDSADAEGVFS